MLLRDWWFYSVRYHWIYVTYVVHFMLEGIRARIHVRLSHNPLASIYRIKHVISVELISSPSNHEGCVGNNKGVYEKCKNE